MKPLKCVSKTKDIILEASALDCFGVAWPQNREDPLLSCSISSQRLRLQMPSIHVSELQGAKPCIRIAMRLSEEREGLGRARFRVRTLANTKGNVKRVSDGN